jgi:muramoyltetrapeptide carboxypeptidase
MGVFDQIHGAIVGFIDGLQNDERALMQMEDVLLRVTMDYEFPVLKVEDFGHNCPNTVLPVGGKVKVDADQGKIEILETCVLTRILPSNKIRTLFPNQERRHEI